MYDILIIAGSGLAGLVAGRVISVAAVRREAAREVASLQKLLDDALDRVAMKEIQSRRLQSAVKAYEADEIARQKQRVDAAKAAGKKSHEAAVARKAAKVAKQAAQVGRQAA